MSPENVLKHYAAGVKLLKDFEGCRLEAYKCPARVWTIGYGSTRYADGTPVKSGDRIIQAEADALLANVLAEQVLPALRKILHWEAMSADQQGALISFAWNLGWNFYGAKGFETISAALRDRKWDEVPAALMLYRNPGSSFEEGLKRRREAEGRLWVRGMTMAKPAAPVKPQPASGAKPTLFTLTATQDTWLKKEPVQAGELGEEQKVAVPKGKSFAVVEWEERAADAHARAELGYGAGTWWLYEPHWRRSDGVVAPAPAVDWSDFDCLVTPNLTVGEIVRFDKRRIPGPNASVRQRLLATAAEFQRIRDAWGRPLGVTSFYRPEPINRQVGGVPNSRHVTGQAMDLYPVGASLSGFYQWIAQRWRGGLGDGRSRGFVHLDTDGGGFVPGGGVRPRRQWDY